jgi:uncharacterized protein (DUF433 family)
MAHDWQASNPMGHHPITTLRDKMTPAQRARADAQAREMIHSMSKLEDAEKVVAGLSPAEKAQLLQSVATDLGRVFPGIESHPAVCGGEPCIVRTRIPVWVLEQARRLGTSEAELLRSYPTLRAADLVNAWNYVRNNPGEIERQIRDNEGAS